MSVQIVRVIETLMIALSLFTAGLGWRLHRTLPGTAKKTLAVADVSFVGVWLAFLPLVLIDVWLNQSAKHATLLGIGCMVVTALFVRFYSRAWRVHKSMQKDRLDRLDQLFQIISHATRLGATVKISFDWRKQECILAFAGFGENFFKFAKTFQAPSGQLNDFSEVTMTRYLSHINAVPSNIATIMINSNGTATHTPVSFYH